MNTIESRIVEGDLAYIAHFAAKLTLSVSLGKLKQVFGERFSEFWDLYALHDVDGALLSLKDGYILESALHQYTFEFLNRKDGESARLRERVTILREEEQYLSLRKQVYQEKKRAARIRDTFSHYTDLWVSRDDAVGVFARQRFSKVPRFIRQQFDRRSEMIEIVQETRSEVEQKELSFEEAKRTERLLYVALNNIIDRETPLLIRSAIERGNLPKSYLEPMEWKEW